MNMEIVKESPTPFKKEKRPTAFLAAVVSTTKLHPSGKHITHLYVFSFYFSCYINIQGQAWMPSSLLGA